MDRFGDHKAALTVVATGKMPDIGVADGEGVEQSVEGAGCPVVGGQVIAANIMMAGVTVQPVEIGIDAAFGVAEHFADVFYRLNIGRFAMPASVVGIALQFDAALSGFRRFCQEKGGVGP